MLVEISAEALVTSLAATLILPMVAPTLSAMASAEAAICPTSSLRSTPGIVTVKSPAAISLNTIATMRIGWVTTRPNINQIANSIAKIAVSAPADVNKMCCRNKAKSLVVGTLLENTVITSPSFAPMLETWHPTQASCLVTTEVPHTIGILYRYVSPTNRPTGWPVRNASSSTVSTATFGACWGAVRAM